MSKAVTGSRASRGRGAGLQLGVIKHNTGLIYEMRHINLVGADRQDSHAPVPCANTIVVKDRLPRSTVRFWDETKLFSTADTRELSVQL